MDGTNTEDQPAEAGVLRPSLHPAVVRNGNLDFKVDAEGKMHAVAQRGTLT
jgi:hypothetical protein